MNAKRKVWLVCSGEYEQWSPHAAFATKELAEAYHARYGRSGAPDIIDFDVWEEMPEPVMVYERQGVLRPPNMARWINNYGFSQQGEWMLKAERPYAADETHCAELVESARVTWWNGVGQGICVTVRGNDRVAVNAEFQRLRKAVDNGLLPEGSPALPPPDAKEQR